MREYTPKITVIKNVLRERAVGKRNGFKCKGVRSSGEI
jgi:hypothetical protein